MLITFRISKPLGAIHSDRPFSILIAELSPVLAAKCAFVRAPAQTLTANSPFLHILYVPVPQQLNDAHRANARAGARTNALHAASVEALVLPRNYPNLHSPPTLQEPCKLFARDCGTELDNGWTKAQLRGKVMVLGLQTPRFLKWFCHYRDPTDRFRTNVSEQGVLPD